ncbi:MAG: glycosyltransferase family 2 protein [Candidatus Falkowbacteria bacterium]|nr:glycosyltransferase family 2 protein [Candidatus Falkowbacteria bacterium]
MDLSIIIVNYLSKDKLANCLRSISEADTSGISFEAIIVENNSGEDLKELIQKYNFAKLIVSEKNLGMGGGNNLGVKNSSGELILISNPDIVFKKDSLKVLLTAFRGQQNISLAGPRLLSPDGSLQYSCALFPRWYMPILRRTVLGRLFPRTLADFSMKDFDHQKNIAVDWLFGACFLVRRSDFSGQDLFDERFFMYFEDTDLCRRIWRKGKEVWYIAEAEVFHDHKRDSANKNIFTNRLMRIHLKSWWQYFLKWGFGVRR